jgi:hypothetical protein
MDKPFAKKGPRRIGDLVRPALEPIVAKRGLTQSSLLLDWQTIVGERLAAWCQPARLQWPPRGPKSDLSTSEPATLWLRVAAGRGLDVHYHGGAIMERVNGHFGWRCVSKIAVRPEPMRALSPPALPAEPDAVSVAVAAGLTKAIDDERLRDAMTRLGAGVIAEARHKRSN